MDFKKIRFPILMAVFMSRALFGTDHLLFDPTSEQLVEAQGSTEIADLNLNTYEGIVNAISRLCNLQVLNRFLTYKEIAKIFQHRHFMYEGFFYQPGTIDFCWMGSLNKESVELISDVIMVLNAVSVDLSRLLFFEAGTAGHTNIVRVCNEMSQSLVPSQP